MEWECNHKLFYQLMFLIRNIVFFGNNRFYLAFFKVSVKSFVNFLSGKCLSPGFLPLTSERAFKAGMSLVEFYPFFPDLLHKSLYEFRIIRFSPLGFLGR